ncbi:MAG: hypothetical protein HYZ24_01170 [Chloroflexi bacterium]|nr:hypothetical protein [Chloroflexota bacterium]
MVFDERSRRNGFGSGIAVPSAFVAQQDSAGDESPFQQGLVAQWDSAGDELPFQQGLVAQGDSAGMNPLLSTWKSIEMDSASARGSASMGVHCATGLGGGLKSPPQHMKVG